MFEVSPIKIALLGLLLTFVGCAGVPEAERGPAPKADGSVDEAVDAFRALVFTSAEGIGGGYEELFIEYERAWMERRNKLVKWPSGSVLRVYHQGVRIPDIKPKIEAALNELSELTGIAYQFTDFRRTANFVVNVELEEREELQSGTLGVEKRYRPMPRFDDYVEEPPAVMHGFGVSEDSDDANCCISHVIYRRAFWSRPIIGAHLSIDNLPVEKARECALAHYARAVGLNVTDREIDSFLVRGKPAVEPTDLDALILWALYDPRLESGMSVDQAMPIAREVLREVLEGD